MSLTPVTPPAAPAQKADSAYVETVIRPKKGWIGVDWAELVKHRELLAFLIWRDVKVKYKQAVFGPVWAIAVPLAQVIIYTVIGILMGLNNRSVEGVPYSVYIYAGLLPWLFLNTAIGGGGLSLVSNQALLSKIYMPRLFIPTAVIGSAIVDMLLSFVVFAGMMGFYVLKTHGAFVPSWHMVFLPLLMVVLTMLALGTCYLLSALTVMFRDLKFIIPFITQLGVWLTAVFYPQSFFIFQHKDGTVSDYRDWLVLNPFAGIVQSFRWAITGEPLQVKQLIASVIWSVVLLIGGLFYFKRVERRFADIA